MILFILNNNISKILASWGGSILSISFLESWIKFMTPTMTRKVGLDIGRHVFSGFIKLEMVYSTWILYYILLQRDVLVVIRNISNYNYYILIIPLIILLIQLGILLPILNSRAILIIEKDQEPSKSFIHNIYVILEIIKLTSIFTSSYLL